MVAQRRTVGAKQTPPVHFARRLPMNSKSKQKQRSVGLLQSKSILKVKGFVRDAAKSILGTVKLTKGTAIRTISHYLDLLSLHQNTRPLAEGGAATETELEMLKRTAIQGLGDRRTGSDGGKTVVLDLDETLIHSAEERPARYDFTVDVVLNQGQDPTKLYVIKRPGVDRLLTELVLRFGYEVIIFTASVRAYAEAIVKRLDPQGTLVSHLLSRECCTLTPEGFYVKDLCILGRDLKSVVIVDDNPNAYLFHPHHAIPVTPFYEVDPFDAELHSLLTFFFLSHSYHDLTLAIRHFLSRPSNL